MATTFERSDIIIVGAGASGLMAARTLAKEGLKIVVLEAKDHAGGRIYTLYNESFFPYAETGAEFIHGDLPVTLQLLKEATIPYEHTGGEIWQYDDGKLKKEEHFIEDWHAFETKIKALEQDMTINDFLNEYFKEEKYNDLKESVRAYAAGYDTADPERASAFALREEWLGEESSGQYRIKGGYSRMIDYLADEFKKYGGQIHLSSAVKEIKWRGHYAEVIAGNKNTYIANKVLITVPVNVLQADGNDIGGIKFSPELSTQMAAIRMMGMGAIIKVLLQFKEAFWKTDAVGNSEGKSMKKAGFIFSQEQIPTWWTQYPAESALLTGWLGGPNAALLKNESDEHILQIALKALATIFSISTSDLEAMLVAGRVFNWTADPFIRGSYSYATVRTEDARKILDVPVAETIYFAGEAFYEGPEMGTVEAALASGVHVARKITESAKQGS